MYAFLYLFSLFMKYNCPWDQFYYDNLYYIYIKDWLKDFKTFTRRLIDNIIAARG